MAFVLVVASAAGARKGLAFLTGWLACLVAVIALVLLVTGGQPPQPRSPPSTLNLAARLVIGVALIAYGIHRRRRPRRPAQDRESSEASEAAAKKPRSSSLASRMDRGSVWAAAALAVFLQPWGLVAAGATSVVEADTAHSATWPVLLAFCLVATAGLLAAELYVVLRPAAARERLMRLRTWMQKRAEPAIVYGGLVIGLWLIGRSVYGLAT